MSGRRQSDRPKKLPSRYIGWYGLRMLTASREKTLKPALISIAGHTADDVKPSAVLQGDRDHLNTFPPDKCMDDYHHKTVLLDNHQSAVSEDERVDHNDAQNVALPDDHQSGVSPDERMDNDHQIALPAEHQIAVPPGECLSLIHI